MRKFEVLLIDKFSIMLPAKRPKFGGRQLGVKNKIPNQSKEVLKSVVNSEIERISEFMDQLTPKDRLDVLCKLLPYTMPKMMEIEQIEPAGVINTIQVEIIKNE